MVVVGQSMKSMQSINGNHSIEDEAKVATRE